MKDYSIICVTASEGLVWVYHIHSDHTFVLRLVRTEIFKNPNSKCARKLGRVNVN